MFSPKKIAAVTALLGGLAVTGAIAPQAYAAEGASLCAQGVQGSAMCPSGNTNYTSDDGTYNIHQSQNCMPTRPLTLPGRSLLNPGSTQLGPALTCSNSAPGSEQRPAL